MNRLYVVLGGLLILGGIAAVIGQAFGLAAVLVVLGLACWSRSSGPIACVASSRWRTAPTLGLSGRRPKACRMPSSARAVPA